jgi:hypothetical protein
MDNNQWWFTCDQVLINRGMKMLAGKGFVGIRNDGNVMLFQNDGGVIDQASVLTVTADYQKMSMKMAVKIEMNGQKYSITFDSYGSGVAKGLAGGLVGGLVGGVIGNQVGRSDKEKKELAANFLNILNWAKTQPAQQPAA